MGHNEQIVGKAVRSYSGNTDQVVIATKGGIIRDGDERRRDGSLGYLRSAVEKSLRALGVEVIDLYQWHRPDRSMIYADAIGNFRTLRDEGKHVEDALHHRTHREHAVGRVAVVEAGLYEDRQHPLREKQRQDQHLGTLASESRMSTAYYCVLFRAAPKRAIERAPWRT